MLAMATAGSAKAQVPTILKPVEIGFAGGAAIPLSDFGKSFSTGYNLTGTVGINPAGFPMGLRFDAAFNQFSVKSIACAQFVGNTCPSKTNAKIADFSGNVVYSLPSPGITPYLIGGIGYYRVSSSVAGSSSSSHVGFNAGGGVKIPLTGFSVFGEARYNRFSETGGSTSFVPVTVGVMF